MNKNLSLIINLFLVVAVAILYFLHFSANTNSSEDKNITNDSMSHAQLVLPSHLNANNILYVNADSLFENYDYVKQIKKEAQSKQANLESRYNDKTQKFQQDYMEYQQKASSGAITESQAKDIEEDLVKRKGELEQMEQQLNKLIEETQKKNVIVQEQVTSFFKEYAKSKNLSYVLAYTTNAGSVLFANDSLDVTKQLVSALNSNFHRKTK